MFDNKYPAITILLATLCTSLSFATSDATHNASLKNRCPSDDWRCKNSFYISGGYIFAHVNYTNHAFYFEPPGKAPVSYSNANNYPNNFSGYRLGYGTNLVDNLPFTYEIIYNQIFPKTKTTHNLQITTAAKALSISLTYLFNPEERFTMGALLGAVILSRHSTFTVFYPNEKAYTITGSGADVDPYIGLSFLYHINSHFSVKFSIPYQFSTYEKSATGIIPPYLVLHYYP